MILTPNASLRDRFLDVLFILSISLIFILVVVSSILNCHVKYYFDKYVSGYQNVNNALVYDGVIVPTPGTVKFEYRDTLVTVVLCKTFMYLHAAFSAAEYWLLASLNPNDSALGTVRKTPLPREHATRFWTSLINTLVFSGIFSWAAFESERDPWQWKGCVMKRDEEGHEIATCTYESAACYVLDWYGIPGKYFTYLCWEAKVAKWCALGLFICACVLVRIFGPQEWRLRKTMRFFFIETKETKEILSAEEAKHKLSERVVGHAIAEAAIADEKK